MENIEKHEKSIENHWRSIEHHWKSNGEKREAMKTPGKALKTHMAKQ